MLFFLTIPLSIIVTCYFLLSKTFQKQHPWPIDAWCGIIGDRTIGPHFFERHLNGEIYADIF